MVILQKLLDRGDQLWHIPEDAATNARVGDFAKPTRPPVHPRTRRRDTGQREAWRSSEPGLHARVRVGRVVVHDDVPLEGGGGLGIDRVADAHERLLPMARQARAKHWALAQAERRTQGGRAVTRVVGGPRPTAALLQGEAGLGAIEGLAVTVLVDTPHQGLVRGLEREADDLVALLDKTVVAAEREGREAMGVAVVVFPDATDRRLAEALRLSPAPRAPRGRLRWLALQRGLDACADVLLGNAWDTTRTWSRLLQTREPKRQESFSPALHGGPGEVQCPRDVLAEWAIGRHLDNVGTRHPSHGETAAMRPRGQSRARFGRQQERGCGSHAPQR